MRGTDTMVRSATVVDFLLNKPFAEENFDAIVVFTGANIPAGQIGSDASNNISGALTTTKHFDFGTFISFSGESFGESLIVAPSRAKKILNRKQVNIFSVGNEHYVGRADSLGGVTKNEEWNKILLRMQENDPLETVFQNYHVPLKEQIIQQFQQWIGLTAYDKEKRISSVKPLVLTSPETITYSEAQTLIASRMETNSVFVVLETFPSGTVANEADNRFEDFSNWCAFNHIPIFLTLPTPSTLHLQRYPSTLNAEHATLFLPTMRTEVAIMKAWCVAATIDDINTEVGSDILKTIMQIPFRTELEIW